MFKEWNEDNHLMISKNNNLIGKYSANDLKKKLFNKIKIEVKSQLKKQVLLFIIIKVYS